MAGFSRMGFAPVPSPMMTPLVEGAPGPGGI
jgi:hypothetical protein